MAAQVSTCNLEFMRAYALSQCEQLRYFETGGQAGASNNYSPPEVFAAVHRNIAACLCIL